MNVRRKYIRSLVEHLLADSGQQYPPVDVNVLARKLHANVIEAHHNDDALSGFLLKQPGSSPAIIGINKSHSVTRRRFTIAHELGHLLLHSFDQVHVDRSGFSRLRLRDSRSSEGVDSEEVEANFFAVELLMPRGMLERDLEAYPDIDLHNEHSFEELLSTLAKKYRVSPQALNIRLVQLGFIGVD